MPNKREPKYKILSNAIICAGEIHGAGAQEFVAKECGVTQEAVWQWIHINGIPKTDFVGETEYANTIQKLTKNKYKAHTLLEERRSIG